MNLYKKLNPYVEQIMKLYSVKSYTFSIGTIQPIIDQLIDSLYNDREGGTATKKKHIVSQSLLRNFTQNSAQTNVYVNGIGLKKIDDWIFCLPPLKRNFWSQEIEHFFNPIEDDGAKALKFFLAALNSNKADELIKCNVKPLTTDKETRMRLILSLYLAMHIERQLVSKGHTPVTDVQFLNRMKLTTASLFFHVWAWCKVSNPTFIVPVYTPIVRINSSEKTKGEYILPLSPTVALFVATDNFASYFTRSYIFDEREETDPAYELIGIESALLNTSEDEGQQRFVIQSAETSYTVHHSNSRLKDPKNEIYHLTYEFFLELSERLKVIFPVYVRP